MIELKQIHHHHIILWNCLIILIYYFLNLSFNLFILVSFITNWILN